jgi:hypothetical protein
MGHYEVPNNYVGDMVQTDHGWVVVPPTCCPAGHDYAEPGCCSPRSTATATTSPAPPAPSAAERPTVDPRPDPALRKCGLTCVGLREGTADSAKVPGNYAGVVGESNMSTLLAVVPRVFAGLPLICEQSPGDRANRTLVAERRTGRQLIESDRRRRTECVTPDHIYEVVFIEFRFTTAPITGAPGEGDNINPGLAIAKTVVSFDVPVGAAPEAIELHDSAFSGGVKVSLAGSPPASNG